MNFDPWGKPDDDDPFVPPPWEDEPDAFTAGSATSATTAGSIEGSIVLDDVREWLARYVIPGDDADLDLLTLWAAHTHLVTETYTTPRLVLDSPVPGSGKTTVLEHLERLCFHSVQMATVSSPAMLVRLLDAGMRTILIDEADRSLNPKKEGIADLIAVLNSGYKRGATRPVNVPAGKDGWRVAEMPTFSPVAMAGNNPDLPEDTKSRCIRVLLMPDIDGTAEESDWEWIEDDALALAQRLSHWADLVRDQVKGFRRPPLPEGVKGRGREKWGPLKRVAMAAGGRWPAVVDNLARQDMDRVAIEREDGLAQARPAVTLLGHVKDVWPENTNFVSTERLIDRLVGHHPETWGAGSSYGKRLTAQRLGRMLVSAYNIHSSRPDANGPRGYTLASLTPAFRRSGLVSAAQVSKKPDEVAEPAEPAVEPDLFTVDPDYIAAVAASEPPEEES